MKKFIIYDSWRNVWLSSDNAKRLMNSIMDFDGSIIELEVNPAQDQESFVDSLTPLVGQHEHY